MKTRLSKWVIGTAVVALSAFASGAFAGADAIPGMGEWRLGANEKANPGLGTWSLNVARSKFMPGPAPKSMTVTITAVGKGVKVTTAGVNADGSKSATEYTANFDGKDAPFKGSPDVDAVSLVRKDGSTTVRTDKKGGKVVQTVTRVVALDDSFFTVSVKGTDAKGQAIDSTLVFDHHRK